jgi:hypothetical protein
MIHMAMHVSEVKRWLETLGPDADVAIDEGGLQLLEVGGGAYVEVGGEPNSETHYTNYYVHCKHEWNDQWSCMCNDECPECGTGDIEPYASLENESGETIMHVGPDFIPEDGLPDGMTSAAALEGWDAAKFKPESEHNSDSDCTVDQVTRLCVTCGVMHGEPCPTCGGKGFHTETCPDSDANHHTYSLDAGRVIMLQGKAVCCINWVPRVAPDAQYPMTPVDMDDLAKRIVALLNGAH